MQTGLETGCYPDLLKLAVILHVYDFARVRIGRCRSPGLRYLRIFFMRFVTLEYGLGVRNCLDLFFSQHIGIGGSCFERLVTHQLLGGLDVSSCSLNLRAEGVSGGVEGYILLYADLLGYPFEGCIHIGMGRKVKHLVVLATFRHPCHSSRADWDGIKGFSLLLEDNKCISSLVLLDV